MIHTIEPAIQHLHGRVSCERKPILTIDSGDSVISSTLDAAWGFEAPAAEDSLPKTILLDERTDPENDAGICLVGPVAIRGTEPGMTLEVIVDELQVGSYGITMTGTSPSSRYKKLGLDGRLAWMMWQFDRDRELATNRDGHKVAIRPFLGCMGNAPAPKGYHPNQAGRNVGGNIDCKELTVGSRLYLPIETPGALFSFGDGHAAQGDGEVCGWAIECPMERVKLSFKVLNDMPLKWPVARTESSWITFGFSENLTDAMYIALNSMLDLMTNKLGVSRTQASMLASTAVNLRITQIVNPTMGVHAVLADDAIK